MFTLDLGDFPLAGGALAGRGAGATVVCGAAVAVELLHCARTLLYHLVQSVVVADDRVVVFVAPTVVPVGVCAAAALQADLFALPLLVQSYWRVVVVALVVTVLVRVTGAAATDFAAGFAAALQAALLALSGLEQS